MKKATPGNNYVFLKRQEIGYTEYSERNQAEWKKYKAEFLSTLPKDEAEKRAPLLNFGTSSSHNLPPG